MKASFGTTALVVAGIVVFAAIVTGIIMVGTPTEGRLERLDARRVQDLKGIMQATDSVWARSQRLPASLQELADDPRLNVQIIDPGSGEQYEYTVVGEDSYELCATFDRESPERAPRPSSEFWRHGPGRHCFALSAIKAGSEGGT
jgi:hypothetical protein